MLVLSMRDGKMILLCKHYELCYFFLMLQKGGIHKKGTENRRQKNTIKDNIKNILKTDLSFYRLFASLSLYLLINQQSTFRKYCVCIKLCTRMSLGLGQ